MNPQLHHWLTELKVEFTFSPASDRDEQARENLHSFSWVDSDRERLQPDEIAEFITGCSDIVMDGGPCVPLVFYAWVDELAGQLRFSAISGTEHELPFACGIRLSPVQEVADEFIAMKSSLYEEGYIKIWARGKNV